MPEGDEHESCAGRIIPWHRAAHNERFWCESFLRRALHMRRFRSIGKFFIVGLAASNRIVLVMPSHRFEAIEIVHPLLHSGEACTIESNAMALNDCRCNRRIVMRIFSAVFVPGQIAAAVMTKCIDRTIEYECFCQRFLDQAAAME